MIATMPLRALRSLVTFFVFLVVTATVAGVLGMYLAVATKNLPMLRAVVTYVGRLVAGQETERMDLDVQVRPAAAEIGATARLQVRAKEGPRQRLYFLLNDGLRIQRVWQEDTDGKVAGLRSYQLGPVTVVTLASPLATNETTVVAIEYRGTPSVSGLAGSRAVLTSDQILIGVEAFWYPTDLQSFFAATVRVTLPAELALLHNGREVRRTPRGRAVSVEWATERPVAGLALVAGRYREVAVDGDQTRYRVALPDGVGVEASRVASALQASDELLRSHYGPAGFPQITLFVNRTLSRAFNDGSGLIGIPLRYFRGGDYGFGSIAHEVAHNWWGATVAERWLEPGTGGEWIVEGFAEFSSILATQAHLGEAASVRRLEAGAYDPTQPRVLAEMSVLDNGLDPLARPTIYQKGAYVTFMLRQLVDDETFFASCRQLLDRFRYRQVSDRDVESVFAEVSQQDLSTFFSAWVRSDAGADLSLDPTDGGAAVRNHGAAWAPSMIALWRFPAGGEPERERIALESSTTLGTAARLVLDPTASVADMYRSNNVFPRRPNPRAVAVSRRGEVMVVYGEPQPWAPATVAHIGASGEVLHSWDFDRGVHPEPSWTVDGTRILAIETDLHGRPSVIALSIADGSRQRIGRDAEVSGTTQGTVVARGDRLLHLTDRGTSTLTRHRHRDLGTPLLSPDGSRIAYTSSTDGETELRVVDVAGANDRLLLTWERTDVSWQWSPGGAHFYAVLPGDWDWQLWEVPADGAIPRALVREAAAIGGLAVAADGRRIAVVAAATLNYAHEKRDVFVLDRESGATERFHLHGATAHGVAWLNADELLVIVSDPDTPTQPRYRELRRLALRDGSLAAFP